MDQHHHHLRRRHRRNGSNNSRRNAHTDHTLCACPAPIMYHTVQSTGRVRRSPHFGHPNCPSRCRCWRPCQRPSQDPFLHPISDTSTINRSRHRLCLRSTQDTRHRCHIPRAPNNFVAVPRENKVRPLRCRRPTTIRYRCRRLHHQPQQRRGHPSHDKHPHRQPHSHHRHRRRHDRGQQWQRRPY